MRLSRRRKAPPGFGLLALAIWMTGIGLAVVLVLALLPNRTDQARMQRTISAIEDGRDAVLGFVVERSRLPSPDTDNDGIENVGAVTGALPYRDMELPVAQLDQASLPLWYTPYRSAAVDLTVAAQLYEPALPDLSGLSLPELGQYDPDPADFDFDGGVTYPPDVPPVPQLNMCQAQILPSPINLLDFCTGLRLAIAASSPPLLTSVNVGPAPNENVAYALLSGGLENADGVGSTALDGPNGDGDVTYEDPARGRGYAYDDVVRATRFSTLERDLSCEALLESVNLLAAVAESGKGILEGAIASYSSSEAQVVMGIVAILSDIVAIALTVQSGIGIAADIAKTAGGCASIILSANCCPALAVNIAGAVVYAVTIVVQIATLIAKAVALGEAIANRNLFRSEIIPRANANLCSAIREVVQADIRGGLISKAFP